jgi:glycosyltransferase involved in cell wall biosynthesis
VWAGLRRDMPDVCFASDLVVLTSDNEGTPVSLIEAEAAGVPVVGTAVGGMASVVLEGETGRLAAPEDEAGFAAHVRELLDNPELSRKMGSRGQDHALANFKLERLTADIDRLYRQLPAEPEALTTPAAVGTPRA